LFSFERRFVALPALVTFVANSLAPGTALAWTPTKGPFLQGLGPTGVTIKVEIDPPARALRPH
jgi:hypothetical protein